MVEITKEMTRNKINIMMYHDIIECLTEALEAKDIYTKGHSVRVADMVYEFEKSIGLTGKELEKIHIAAHLHDIGKIGIPDYILRKKGKLNAIEWEWIKKHPKISSDILSKSWVLKDISNIVLHHHERWDGKGYPHGISGEDIPFGSRIIAIFDTIDAMRSQRPYRMPIPWEQCKREIEINAGTQFDSYLVEKTLSNWDKWKKVAY